MVQSEFACPWYFPSIAEFTSVLEKHGIEVTLAELYDRPTRLEHGEEGMRNWIRMFGDPFVVFAAESVDGDVAFKEEFVRAVAEKLRPVLFDGEQWTADYRRIRIVGRKLSY